ncbi:MAG: hypothetical protein HGB36_00465 [Chlorobiaceae bacterium]|nr:hypothetical protein [Chlorobiaceae bacterium]
MFIDIINCTKKSELEKLCKTSTIKMSDFVDYIMVCEAGLTHLNHIIHFVDFVPPDVETKDDDWKILDADRTFQATKEGQQAFRRLFKTHGMRQYRVGHMFFTKEISHPLHEWHFFFFEVNELQARDNHWRFGSHVHLTNYLWPKLYCQKIWKDFIFTNAFPKSKLHLSCIDDT